jgi:hypothetical protein
VGNAITNIMPESSDYWSSTDITMKTPDGRDLVCVEFTVISSGVLKTQKK